MMENILENTTNCIWAIDKDYHILYLNNSFRDDFKNSFGVELKQGDDILEKLPAHLGSIWKSRYDKALQGQRYSFDDSLPDKNNNLIYIQVSFSPILSNNKITGVTCTGRNITENKLNEIELKKNSLLLKSCLESQKDTTLLSIDKNFNYLYYNSAHYDAMKYGYGIEVEVGMNILDCLTDNSDRNAVMENYRRALNGESHSNVRIYGDKNKEYYESFFNPIKDDTNKIIGATALARNISARVKQDEAIKESEKSLQEANVAKDKFFSIISHDLRSPISSISSLANIMYEKFDDFETIEQKEFLKSICVGLGSSYALLEDLLLWSKSQNNTIKFIPKKIDLSDLTNGILEILDQNIVGKELVINKNYLHAFEIYADKQMISTIIRNLLSNAIKFSHNQGVIEIEFKTITEEYNKNVLISIRDYGVGISKERLNKVFSIGESISTLGTNNEKGTGLGLIMCKEFTDRHNGTITIESSVNEGTIISVLLPQK